MCLFMYLLFPNTSCWASVVVSLHCCLLQSDGETIMLTMTTSLKPLYHLNDWNDFNSLKGVVLTLTRCPKANENCFCTTVLLSWIPLSRALISLPGNVKVCLPLVHLLQTVSTLQEEMNTLMFNLSMRWGPVGTALWVKLLHLHTHPVPRRDKY